MKPITPIAVLLLLVTAVPVARAVPPTPDELRATLASADTVQVSSFVLDWRDSTVAGEHQLISLRHRLAFAQARSGWADRFAFVLIPAGVTASTDVCPVLSPGHAGPGPWLASIAWGAKSGRGQAVVDLADRCAYVVSAGREPVSIALGERVDDLYGMLREALPADTVLAAATAASMAARAVADTALPAITDAVQVDSLPVALNRVPPAYPDSAREARIDGTVVVKALVDREGRVRDVRVITSIPALDESAKAAVRQWQFHPARFRNHPVAVWVSVPVRYSLH